MHLADAFIQSDLHSGYTFSLVSVFPGNRTHNLLRCWRNALPLSHTGIFHLLFKPFSKPTMALKTSSQDDANEFGANIGSLFTCTWAGTWWPAELCRRPSDAGNCWRGTGSCAPSEQHITDREHSRFLQRDRERGQLSLKYQPHFLLFI